MSDSAMVISSVDQYGGLANVRRLHEQNKKEYLKKEAALMEEIERTGMIQNEYGEMVELSSLNDAEKNDLIGRAKSRLCSREEIVIGLLATAPNNDDVERSKALAEKFRPIQDKMLAGKKLTAQEMNFLRENYPEFAATAERMEAEAKALEQKLKACKDPKDAQRVFTEAKTRIMSGASKKDGSILFLSAALDEAYKKHMNRGASGITMDIFA